MKKVIFLALINLMLFQVFAQKLDVDSLENLLKKYTQEDTGKVNLLNKTAFEYRKIDLNKTFKYANIANELSGKINYPKGKAESLRMSGIFYYYKSEYTKALEQYEKSLKISKEYKDKEGIAKCCNNIGNVHRKQGNFLKALENFQKSLQIAEIIGDKQTISSSLGNIGLIYWREKDYGKALEYYKKSLSFFDELGNKKGISNALNNIGILYYFQNDYSKSLEYLKKSLEIDKELGDKSGISYSYNNIAEIYLHIGDYSKSLENNLKSLDIRKEIGDKYGTCTSYKGIGAVYFYTKNYAKALEYTKKSLKIAVDLNMLEEQKDLYEQLSEIYSDTKNYKEAFRNHVLYKELNDSIFNEENIKKITGLEYQYKYEKEKQAAELIQLKKDAVRAEEAKREKIIKNSFIFGFVLLLILVIVVLRNVIQKRKANIILSKQKNKIEEKNIQLRQLNNTQNKLMSIISHDFKAPLSAFYSITSSLKTKFDKIERSEIENYFNRMLNSSVALKLQLENMLNWSVNQTRKINVSKKMTDLHIISFKVVMILQEFANEKSITIKNNISENFEILTDGKLLSIVLNNLISNAVKYSDAGSKIIISAQKNNDKILISVKDFGKGMTGEDAENLFSNNSNLHHENSGTGLGLIVSKDIIKKLGGKIRAESEINKGTEIFIEL